MQKAFQRPSSPCRDVVTPLSQDNAPDPFTTYDPVSGYYYHIHTENPNDGSFNFTSESIVIHRSRYAGALLNGSESRVVYRVSEDDGVFGFLWAPEMHRAPNGKWYIYTSCTRSPGNHTKRLLVLEARTDDPFDGFVFKSFPDESIFAIDPTVFTDFDGRQYACYSEVLPGKGQFLRIREMVNPWTFGERRSELVGAELPWERVPPYDRSTILEGAFFVRGSTPSAVSLVYSANGCWSRGYCLGVLDYFGGDICDIRNWRKRPMPVFAEGNGVYGPGHASFFRSPDGSELWVSHHFLMDSNETDGPTCRYFAMQRFEVNKETGLPSLTLPVKPGTPRNPPSGE